jgi:uncharacterized protein
VSSLYRIPVALLLRDVPSTQAVVMAAPFDERRQFLPRGIAETDIAPDAEVDVNLQIQSFVGGLWVRGEVAAPWFGVCRRCSLRVEGRTSVILSERYVDERRVEDDDAYLIENDFIDLEPMIHDALLLEIPLAPLCREDCAGLCLHCGGDRNETPCDCQAPTDPRWATLDGLKFVDDSSTESNEA